MRTKIALLLTVALIAGLAAVFANGFYGEINGDTSASNNTGAYDDGPNSNGDQKTLETSQYTWWLSYPPRFDPYYAPSSSVKYPVKDPYLLKDGAELVIVGMVASSDSVTDKLPSTIASSDPVVSKLPNYGGTWYYIKSLVNVDQIISGSYERDTIDVVTVEGRRVFPVKGDQVVILLTRSPDYYGDSWITLAMWHRTHSISGDVP